MKNRAAIFAISVGLLAVATLMFIAKRDSRGTEEPARSIESASSTSEDPTVAAAPEASDNAIDRPTNDEQTEQRSQEVGGVSIQAQPTPITARPIPGGAQRVDLVNAIRGQLSASRLRAFVLEQDNERLRLELDECRNGPDSPLGTLYALPEWSGLNTIQRTEVQWFLERFPIHLQPGEATLIANHVSPTGDTTAELILMLGPKRVRDAMPADARTRMQTDYPDEWREYFGMTY